MPARTRTETTKTKAATTAKATKGKSTTAARGKATPANGHGTKLVIVESPSKARTIAGYLGQGYVVESSVGHIRDMPDSAAEIPAKYRGEPWARLGVDVDHDFEPLYVVHSDKRQQVSKLKSLLKDADELLLATDEDREGEAIAWHLLEELKPKVPAQPDGLPRDHPGGDRPGRRQPARPRRRPGRRLPDAPGARPAVRLRGLARAVEEGHAAAVRRPGAVGRHPAGGRPRAGADRVPRRPPTGTSRPSSRRKDHGKPTRRPDQLPRAAGHRGRPPGRPGPRLRPRPASSDATARRPAPGRRSRRRPGRSAWRTPPSPCPAVERKPYRRSPYAPFRTTTLQQEASRKLGFSRQAHDVGRAAAVRERLHHLYAHRLGDAVRDRDQRGPHAGRASCTARSYVPDAPRTYASKVKNAQEAHEAIRPAGDSFRTPAPGRRRAVRRRVPPLRADLAAHRRLADEGRHRRVGLGPGRGRLRRATSEAEFGASGKVITFYGFLKAYVEGTDDAADRDDRERRLPPLAESDPLDALRLAPAEHATRPPARYTEASLVKELEEREIGRPSTYASIIGTILDRGYVFKKGTALVPSFLAFAVVTLLERHFAPAGRLRVHRADGGRARRDRRRRSRTGAVAAPVLLRRPDGDGDGADRGLKALVADLGDIDAREVSSFPLARHRHRGPGRPVRPVPGGGDGQRANVPEDIAPDELTVEKAEELLSTAQRATRARHRPGQRPRRSWPRPGGSARTSPSCCPRTPRSRPSRGRPRCSSRWRWTR